MPAEEEEKMRIRGFSVENVKELALTAWNVLIFIIWIKSYSGRTGEIR
ncbi:MAG: hypothetical protein ACLTBV_27815 [Enterocloster bolteae]